MTSSTPRSLLLHHLCLIPRHNMTSQSCLSALSWSRDVDLQDQFYTGVILYVQCIKYQLGSTLLNCDYCDPTVMSAQGNGEASSSFHDDQLTPLGPYYIGTGQQPFCSFAWVSWCSSSLTKLCYILKRFPNGCFKTSTKMFLERRSSGASICILAS